ncbi:SLATT domain-containing protein [Sphingobacterium wenxiniae]|uniref:SMODS and SLOG-associating 2TM effector domain-containing protein n=1 Tax=Sphingobacterium wenxiniae TaxID=683125 RepID=A0A1I6VPX1_9SPHI|nr:SLATT domain-containing protein [Sphingobacterium wenxiniae]SFT15772.1 hypothetical protein SAMN05660206_11620 [Sphingobacterium wenxiniae]
MEQKSYLKKLDDDLWITKGARFAAHSRLMMKARISNITVGILTCYLIALGLLSVYNILEPHKVDANFLAFGSTAISILVLLFSQIEVANDYKVRAIQHHTCALKIAELHRKVKTFGMSGFPLEISEYDYVEKITKEYGELLANFDNHKTSDYNKFCSLHSKYFGLNYWQTTRFRSVYYIDIYWFYSVLIIAPLIGFCWLLIP